MIELLILLGMVGYLGWRLGCWYMKNNILDLLEEEGFTTQQKREIESWAKKEQQLLQPAREIYLEKTNGIYYAFDSLTDTFLGQHQDREELFKYIATTHGEGRYSVVDKSAD